jgi:hypothetical protein
LVNKFKYWDGFLDRISFRTVISMMFTYGANKTNEFNNNGIESSTNMVVTVGKNEVVYEKNGDDYFINAIN